MARKEIVTLECDLCGVNNGQRKGRATVEVEEHTIAIDGRATRVIDACGKCWVPYQAMLKKLIDAGRSAKRSANAKRRLAGVS